MVAHNMQHHTPNIKHSLEITPMQLIGHRGARGEAPENTLGGFRYLSQLGLRGVEFDVRMLSDGTLVVLHDDNLLRTTSVLRECARAELAQFDQRKGWPAWPTPEPLPLLSEVLAMLVNFDHIEIEIKAVHDLISAHALVGRLLDQIRGLRDRVTVTSFDLNVLRALQMSRAPVRRGLLIEQRLPTDVIDLIQSLGCVHLGIQDTLCGVQLVESLQQHDLYCSVWTVNNIDRALQLDYWGVDGLITDMPSKMLQHQVGSH
jgi:glycerophosphoryl diester phosphodiesterase